MTAHSDQELMGALNHHGYFFQPRIESEINNNATKHSWEIVGREHPWRNADTTDNGFIDLILKTAHARMVIEAKRVDEGTWAFIVAENLPDDAVRANLLWLFQTQLVDGMAGWFDFSVEPSSSEAVFCVRMGKKNEDHALESIAAPVIGSLESLAGEDIHRTALTGIKEIGNIYVPVIVTTAELRVCQYDANAVSLTSGRWLDSSESKLRVVPYVRFRKGFHTRLNTGEMASSLDRLVREGERTVFIVNAAHLIDFLANFRILRDRPAPWDTALGIIVSG